MTDNEIITALKNEIRRANYIESYYIDCVDIGIFQNALDLINRQKEEIERLKKNIDGLNIFTKNHIKVIRLQAIKEFVERLKEKLNNLEYHENSDRKTFTKAKLYHVVNWIMHEVVPDEIHNIVKEMTEVETNQRKEDEGK